MRDFHQEQLSILQKLLYSNGLKYSFIKPLNMEGSKFTFHLDQLMKTGYVKKENSLYFLTDLGKEMANRMDLGDEKIFPQAKVSALMVCLKETEIGREILLYTRLKSPFYSYQGFPTGKIKRGEDILEGARRELKEETGLSGDPELISIRHYKVYNEGKELIEDKIFFVCRFINPEGKILPNPEGKYQWVKETEAWDYLKKPVPEVKEIFDIINTEKLIFTENEYTTSGF